MAYKRLQVAENIGYSEVIDSKFKTGILKIDFITELSEDTIALNVISAGTASVTNSKYPSITDFSARLNELYGSYVFSHASKLGDNHIINIGASWLDNKYALEGEDIETETVKMLLDCIFSPDVKNGAFNDVPFSITKKELLDKIDAEINNKRGYAISQASKTAFVGEPAENSAYGTKKQAEKVSSADAYQNFLNLIRNSRKEIYYVAAQPNENVKKLVFDAFSKYSSNSQKDAFISFSPIKENVAEVTEELDVNQSKMVMVFKSEKDDKYAMKLASAIFGETPFSKLFVNVREKLSLCYYCSSSYVRSKNSIFVSCGVEYKNVETARKEILNQLDEIRNGNFSDDEWKNTLLSIENSLSATGDTLSSYISWCSSCIYDGSDEILTPQQILEKYQSVTRERIIDCAKSLVLDTVYVMKSKEAQ